MIKFNEPKKKELRKIEKLVLQAVRDADDEVSGFVGDLIASDAEIAADILERNGFTTKIESETDRVGALVDSKNWKLVRFELRSEK